LKEVVTESISMELARARPEAGMRRRARASERVNIV
jgi:hypothetical protein